MGARFASLLCLVAATCFAPAVPAHAAGGGSAVAVFEGRGLGHGVGLPLDGANALALDDESADDILDRFFPGAGRGQAQGLVRVLLATRDDTRAGIEVTLPDGGTIRDGRETPVAPSFPLTVPAGGRVRLTFSDDFSRAEVLDERSVSGTVELTPGSETPTTTPPPDAPGLGTSQGSLWIQPRGGGRLVMAPEAGGDPRPYRGLTEMVVEAERLHLVAELDVEAYLAGLDLSVPGGTALEPAALEAAMVAARSYALRSALAEPRVGRFHLHADGRSLPYVGRDDAGTAAGEAAKATEGRILEADDGTPAVAMITVSAAGETAPVAEIYGRASALPYLPAVEYPEGEAFEWRVDIPLAEIGRRLEYPGSASSIAVDSTGPTGRPTSLRVSGDAGDVVVRATTFHAALRLPASRFEVRVEERAEPVAERVDAPAFQELPGEPLSEEALAAAAGGEARESGRGGVPFPVIVIAGATLIAAFVVLLVADVHRRMRQARERRDARQRDRTPRPVAPAAVTARVTDPAVDVPATPSATAVSRDRLGPALEREEGAETNRGAPVPPADLDIPPPGTATPSWTLRERPRWHNEPEWLADLLPDEGEAPGGGDDLGSVDEARLRREVERLTRPASPAPEVADDDEEPPETRPLRELLGWDDAPSWLDEPEAQDTTGRPATTTDTPGSGTPDPDTPGSAP